MVRAIKEVEGSYYPCSENKGADQLRGYREADLRLCFRIYAKCWFSHNAAQMYVGIFYVCEAQREHNLPKDRSLKVLIMILEIFYNLSRGFRLGRFVG